MKRTIALAVVLLAVSSTAQAVKPAPTERQVVGWTGTPFAGTTGLLTLIQACGSAFPGSTVATSTDVANTTTPVVLPTGLAWLRPELVVATQHGTSAVVYDKSGVVATGPNSFTLGASAGGTGLVMSEAGQFSIRNIPGAGVFPVACAK